jgi:hypothetical protein
MLGHAFAAVTLDVYAGLFADVWVPLPPGWIEPSYH